MAPPVAYTSESSSGWTFQGLLNRGPRFRPVRRLDATKNTNLDLARVQSENTELPLVIGNFHKRSDWPTEIFDLGWLRDHGPSTIVALKMNDRSEINMTIREIVDRQLSAHLYPSSDEPEIFYGKDAPCPKEWKDFLESSDLFPRTWAPHQSTDFLQCLPPVERVETLMCYLGTGGTFTPCHKDLCASTGQNLMVYSEHGGSSFWFMTKSSSASAVSEYLHTLGEEVDLETYMLTIEDLERAPFDVYIAEQKLGDLVIVPPRSCHQVVNCRGITVKASWSRMTLKGLGTALYHELPIYQRVCRPETYRIKSSILSAVASYQLKNSPANLSTQVELDELNGLIQLLDYILVQEYSTSHRDMQLMQSVDGQDYAFGITCDFCGSDIFQSCFECGTCADGEDTFNICPGCYTDGRTCKCRHMRPMQVRRFGDLITTRNLAVHLSFVNNQSYNRPTTMTEGVIADSASASGVFQAACILHGIRNTAKQDARICQYGKHDVPSAEIGCCDGCQNCTCFSHLLTFGLHASEALLYMPRDRDLWRQHFNSRSSVREQTLVATLDLERRGMPCHAQDKLVSTAQRFSACIPINTERIHAGFYDYFKHAAKLPNAGLAEPQSAFVSPNVAHLAAILPPAYASKSQKTPIQDYSMRELTNMNFQ